MNDNKLLSELNADPAVLGYAVAGWSAAPPSLAQYQAVANLVNASTQSEETDVTGEALFLAIRPADFEDVYASGTVGQQKYLERLFGFGTVPLKTKSVQMALRAIFAGKTATLLALAALQLRSISRARELGIPAVKVGDLRRLKGDKS